MPLALGRPPGSNAPDSRPVRCEQPARQRASPHLVPPGPRWPASRKRRARRSRRSSQERLRASCSHYTTRREVVPLRAIIALPPTIWKALPQVVEDGPKAGAEETLDATAHALRNLLASAVGRRPPRQRASAASRLAHPPLIDHGSSPGQCSGRPLSPIGFARCGQVAVAVSLLAGGGVVA